MLSRLKHGSQGSHSHGQPGESGRRTIGARPLFQGCCPCQRFLTVDLLPFPLPTPSREHLLLLRAPLGSSPSTGTSESLKTQAPLKSLARTTHWEGQDRDTRQQAGSKPPKAKEPPSSQGQARLWDKFRNGTKILTCIEETCYRSLCPGFRCPHERSVLCKDLCEGEGLGGSASLPCSSMAMPVGLAP